ncbi:hypothetical protein [Pseudocolwellia sp. HL-MZ7]|uniref:hypothetical protein n=1 Tax=Pseudocolwellia sp. HL-MZ7 TaxID=3400627 RepID=UPI003CF9D7E8
MKRIFIIFCMLFTLSCSELDKGDSCSITVDSVSIIDSIVIKNKTYYLVYRVSGWSDKTEILELYDSKPIFDNCSNSKTAMVFGDSLESSKIVTHVYLNPSQNTLEITYIDGIPDGKSNSILKLQIR